MKKKSQVKKVVTGNEIVTYQATLDKLINQRTELSIKIDELNNKISEAVNNSVTEKLNKFFKTLSKEELDALNRTDLFEDDLYEFIKTEHEEIFED